MDEIAARIGPDWEVVSRLATKRDAATFRNKLAKCFRRLRPTEIAHLRVDGLNVIARCSPRPPPGEPLSRDERLALMAQWDAFIRRQAARVNIGSRDDVLQAMLLAAWEATGSYDRNMSQFQTHLGWQLYRCASKLITAARPKGFRIDQREDFPATVSADERRSEHSWWEEMAEAGEERPDEYSLWEWDEILDSLDLSPQDREIMGKLVRGVATAEVSLEFRVPVTAVREVRIEAYRRIRSLYDRNLRRKRRAADDDDESGG